MLLRLFLANAAMVFFAAASIPALAETVAPSDAPGQAEDDLAACKPDLMGCIINDAMAILLRLDAPEDAPLTKDLVLQILVLGSPEQQMAVLQISSPAEAPVDLIFELKRAVFLGPEAVTTYFKASGRLLFETVPSEAMIDLTRVAMDQGSKVAVSKLLPGLLVRSVGDASYQVRLAIQAASMAAYSFLGDDTRAAAQFDRMMKLFDVEAVQGQDEAITSALTFWLMKSEQPGFIAPFITLAKAKGTWVPSTGFHGCALAMSGDIKAAQTVMEKSILGLILDIGQRDPASKPGRIYSLHRMVWMFRQCGPGVNFDRMDGMIAKAMALYTRQAEAQSIPALRFIMQVALHVPDSDPDLIRTSAARALHALRQDGNSADAGQLARSVLMSLIGQRTINP